GVVDGVDEDVGVEKDSVTHTRRPGATGAHRAAGRLAAFADFGDRIQGALYLIRPDERLQIIPHECVDGRAMLERPDTGSAKHIAIHDLRQFQPLGCHAVRTSRAPHARSTLAQVRPDRETTASPVLSGVNPGTWAVACRTAVRSWESNGVLSH